MKYYKKIVPLAGLLCGMFMVSCSGVNFMDWRFPYMYPVQQGNYITEQQVSLLRAGMTKEQVANQIGTPVTSYMFESDSWQYVYQQYKNNKLDTSYILNINFSNNMLTDVESSGDVFSK